MIFKCGKNTSLTLGKCAQKKQKMLAPEKFDFETYRMASDKQYTAQRAIVVNVITLLPF